MSKLESPEEAEARNLREDLKQIEIQRQHLRTALRNTRGPLRRIFWFFRRRKWQKDYGYLGLVWAQKRPWNELRGLDLTGATLLNDNNEKIDSDTFKKIANDKVMGPSDAPEYYLKAEFHDKGPGTEIPASEVFDDPYGDYPFKVYRQNMENPGT